MPEPHPNSLLARIDMARRNLQPPLSRRAVCIAAGVSEDLLRGLSRRKNGATLNATSLAAFSRVLGVSVGWLLNETDGSPGSTNREATHATSPPLPAPDKEELELVAREEGISAARLAPAFRKLVAQLQLKLDPVFLASDEKGRQTLRQYVLEKSRTKSEE